MTLLELLIVMTIMVMVTAAAIPIVLPAIENRQMREASRLVASYIQGARSRAIETGRPVGVMFQRVNGLPFSGTLSYVEVPQPYSGDTLNSRILISNAGITPGQVTDFATSDTSWSGLVRYGDLIRLDYKGPYFIIASGTTVPDPSFGQIVLDPTSTPWQLLTFNYVAPNLPAAYATPTGVAFQIFRQPTRSSAAPLVLPEGTAIDLIYSGVGQAGTISTIPLTWDPVFTFSPNGAVDRVGIMNANLFHPTGPLFFLVGRRELMPDVAFVNTTSTPEDKNLYDSDTPTPKSLFRQNFWVAVDYQTGHVSTTENLGGTPVATYYQYTIGSARNFAIQGQSVGGR